MEYRKKVLKGLGLFCCVLVFFSGGSWESWSSGPGEDTPNLREGNGEASGSGPLKAVVTYQDGRFPQDQYDIIKETDEYAVSKNCLEVGCNKGELVRFFVEDGRFAVGIDLKDYWSGSANRKLILGEHKLQREDVEKLPEFDIICLLSVHHQWVSLQQDAPAQDMVRRLFDKSRVCMFIEFAALASKYKYAKNARFRDNDETSVVEYGKNWLEDGGIPSGAIQFLGKTREHPRKEPYRFLFKLTKLSA